jgi:aldose 1-epimerase
LLALPWRRRKRYHGFLITNSGELSDDKPARYVGGDVIEAQPRAAGALTLVHGGDSCDLFPLVGGSIGGWTVQGQAMLRAASAASVAARDPFGMSSFPLVPYSNRIANGGFKWGGRLITMARNFPPEPHAIHGVGFQRPWQVHSRSGDSAVLTLSHQGDANWPWAFEASQHITIAERTLTLHLSAVNLAAHPAPLAFGHHPYFPQAHATLAFRAHGVWLMGDDGLPSEVVKPGTKFDYSHARAVEGQDLDHCFTGCSGPAYIEWAGQPLALEIKRSRELTCAVVYIRSGAHAFCFEPVPHINNALNLPGQEPAMPIVAPGESFHASIRLRAVTR